MPREQNERRPSKPDLPRVETGDAERLATRFNAIHTRWPGESPSTQPTKPGNAPRREPLPDRTSVHVSPILKIDGPTPPMPSGPNGAQRFEAHAASAEAEPWEIDDAPAAQSDASGNARRESENDPGSQSEPIDEASAATIAESELGAQAAAVDATANDTSAAADERLSPTPPLGTQRPDSAAADERLSPTPPLGTQRPSRSVAASARKAHDEGRAGVTATFADDVEHDLDADEPEVARLKPRSRWRWLLAALTIGVAGVSLYRTLYVSKSVAANSTASVIPAAAQPAPPVPPPMAPVLEVEPPVAAAAAAPASAAPAAVAAAPAATVLKSQAPAQQDEVRKAKPSPAPTAPAKSKAPVRKATATAAGKGAAGDKASKATTKQSAKDAASGRRKLSAKPRKPPPKKERTGIIKKSPF